MPIYKLHIYLIILLTILSGCGQEDVICEESTSWQGDDKITLSLNAASFCNFETRALTDMIDEGTSSDYTVSDFILFQFDENGNRIVDPKYYKYQTSSESDPGQVISVVLPETSDVSYTLVVLANIHDSQATLTFADINTLDKMIHLYQSFTKLEDAYSSNGENYDLPMNGFTTVTRETTELHVTLFRDVAKLSLSITNPVGSGVTLKSAQVKSVSTRMDLCYKLLEAKCPNEIAAPYPNKADFKTFDYKADEFDLKPGETTSLVYYLPCNMMGTTSSSRDLLKNINAPEDATYIELYGVDDEWNNFRRYRIYPGENMINDFNIKPNYHYSINLSLDDIGSEQNDSRIESVDGIMLQPDANSFIINPSSQEMYRIPVVNRINTYWVNEMKAGNVSQSAPYTIGSNDEWAVDIIWQSSNQQMIEFYNQKEELTDNDGRVPPSYKGKHAISLKAKPGAKGNVLIGVYRTDQPNADDPTQREYSWSWHLWITDYNPDECVSETKWNGRFKLSVTGGEVHHYTGDLWDAENAIYHNKWIMDRYLGAYEADPSTTPITDLCGLYYQYGRTTPYQRAGYKYYRYDIDSNTYKDFSLMIDNTENRRSEVRKRPYIFFRNKSPRYQDFSKTWNNPAWNIDADGNPSKKSFFDPCPNGWKIPAMSFVSSGTYKSNESYTGVIVSCDGSNNSNNTAFYYEAGYFNGYSTSNYYMCITDYANVGTTYSYFYIFYRNGYTDQDQDYGYNIRPVQE